MPQFALSETVIGFITPVGLSPQLRAATAALDELRKVHRCALSSAAAAAAQLREAHETEWDRLGSYSFAAVVRRSGGTRHSL